jgi:hypothetical protein
MTCCKTGLFETRLTLNIEQTPARAVGGGIGYGNCFRRKEDESRLGFEVALDHDRDIVRSRLLIDHRIAADQLGYSAPTDLNAVSRLEKVRD